MRQGVQCILLYLIVSITYAQETGKSDSLKVLDEVVVQAFGYNRPPLEVPAAVTYVGPKQLQRFANTSLLPVMNTIPGVRMEERSPGSYRFAIRGSSLRSPFGVRNIKVYWNGLPLSDAGNNTYLNQLDFNSVGSAEVIKGPGSSLYGAGTGGVVLLNGIRAPQVPLSGRATLQGGTFETLSYSATIRSGLENANHVVQFNHLQSAGYRDHSRLIRDMINWQEQFRLTNGGMLSTSLFYTDLFYKTPGGLTEAEMKDDPTQARPNADQRNAHVHAKALYSGIFSNIEFNDYWKNETGAYGHFVQFENSSFRNYERRAEQGGGARSVTSYTYAKSGVQWKADVGAELQFSFVPSKVYDNTVLDSMVLQQDDELNTTQYFFFGQGELTTRNGWMITAGLSYARLKYHFIRLSDNPDTEEKLTYDPEFSPRIAVLKKLNDSFSIYGSLSKGFSPPSYAEVYPSEGTFNTSLAPEMGYNYELGFKGSFFKDQFTSELTLYQFNLEETIVLRRAPDDAEYFVNAGSTVQRGVEVLLSINPRISTGNFLNNLSGWLSYTFNNYQFENYIQDQDDYSGNSMTGVPENGVTFGVDLTTRPGFYLRSTFAFTDEIPLNDANSVYADSYLLLGSKVGFTKGVFEVFAGVDNILDETYSLGNDLNAVNGRYYNPAASRNFFIGLILDLK